MTLAGRDRRALLILGAALVVGGLLYWYSNYTPSSSGGGAKISSPLDSVDRSQKRLAMLRRQAALLPGREAVLKQISLELAQREKGLIPGDTAEQAQAQLLEIIKRSRRTAEPPARFGAGGARASPVLWHRLRAGERFHNHHLPH